MSTAAELRRTPLTDAHEAAGARLVDFSGFLMPVQYDGILDEVQRVRTQAGIFEHLLAVLPDFDLRVFQSKSDGP